VPGIAVSHGLFIGLLLSPYSDFHANTEAAHVAIAGKEVVATKNWLCGLLKSIKSTCMFNAPLYPVPTQQDSERLAARDVLSIYRVIERIAASAG
jgi:hypothetical protein